MAVFGAIYSTCVVYTKKLFNSVSVNSGGYLPRHFADRQISTAVNLNLGE